jgi:hypothetical protein
MTCDIGGMDTYKIDPYGRGWFQVTVTAPNGDGRVRNGFVSELAAQKWVYKCQKTEAKAAQTLSTSKVA